MVKSHEGTEDPTEINALAILGADPDVRELASLERLRLAAKVAQAERNMSEKTRARRWTKDSGETITHGELMGELNKAQKIEIDVAPLPVKDQARVMARQGMSLRKIIEALGLQGIDAPSRQTVWKMVRDILAERKKPCRGCGVSQAKVWCAACRRLGPHHASRARRARFLAIPCAGGCGRLPPESAAKVRNAKVWKCARCAKGQRRIPPTGPCAGYNAPCDAMPAKNSLQPADGPWRCCPCATRKAQAELSGESLDRARNGYRQWWAALSEEQRQEERAKRCGPRPGGRKLEGGDTPS